MGARLREPGSPDPGAKTLILFSVSTVLSILRIKCGQEAFMGLDFFDEKREALDREWGPKLEEIEFGSRVKKDIRAHGPDSIYMKQILGDE